jgi:hypothetical protein
LIEQADCHPLLALTLSASEGTDGDVQSMTTVTSRPLFFQPVRLAGG